MKNTEYDWDRFALLLIDAQLDFWSERIRKGFPDFPARVSELLSFCRDEGLEVIHLRARFKPDMSDWMPKYRLRGRIPCIEGTEGVETLPFAIENPGEKVVVKQTFDGFHNTNLLHYLQEKGKRFLLTAGLVTSTCVLFTTSSATQLGLLTAVVEDCCADQPMAHKDTLERYQFIFHRVRVEQIVEQHSEWLRELRELEG